MDSTAQHRRSVILDELSQHRLVHIADLSERLGASKVLLRRDLQRLQELGLLKRVRGGAVAAPRAAVAFRWEPGQIPRLPEKERIGRAAAELISPGDRLIFDSGTTPLLVAHSIPQDLLADGRLTAITVSLPIVGELGPWKGVHLILLGGIYLPEYRVVVGPQAIENVSGLHADKMFLGSDGLTSAHGVTTANVLEAEVDRALARAASQVIVVADSSKIGRSGLSTIMPLRDIHVLVTDRDAPGSFVAELRSLGVEVILA